MSSPDALLARFYRHATHTDLVDREPAVQEAIAEGVRALAAAREPGRAAAQVLNPSQAQDGWSSRHTIVRIVSDDMPFLVDSVLGELAQQGLTVHALLHPQLVVRHEGDGHHVTVLDQDPTEAESGVESWMHLEVDRLPEEGQRTQLADRLRSVLADVRRAYEDWGTMRQRTREIVQKLQAGAPSTVDPAEVEPTIEFLRWLADDHFTFLGYREYQLDEEDGEEVLRAVPATGLGILREKAGRPTVVSRLRPEARENAHEARLLTITKANSRATVHRPVYLDYIGVRTFDDAGKVIGEQRILGLFTSSAYNESVNRLPIVGGKARAILERSGFAPHSHSGKDLMTVLENFPRDELFQTDTETLAQTAMEVLHLQERRRTRLFLRKDEFGRFVSALVYLPRDRFNTAVRLRMQALLTTAYDAESVDYTTRVGESALAQIHYVVRIPRGASIPDVDAAALERRLVQATRSWEERLADVAGQRYGDEESGAEALGRFVRGYPEGYKEDFDVEDGFEDLLRLLQLDDRSAPMPLHLYRVAGSDPTERRLKIFRAAQITLTDVLPVFSHLGVHVTDERPYEVQTSDGLTRYIYDFGLRLDDPAGWSGGADTEDTEAADRVALAFEEAFSAVWSRQAESDSLNALVLRAGLPWREVVILRTVVRYLRQVGTFSLDYLEAALVANPTISRTIVEMFLARFDPEAEGDRAEDQVALWLRIEELLEEVASLDQDRIIRSVVSVVEGTLRTNFFQQREDGTPKPHVSLKLDPRAIPGLPEPRPAFEIWVYAPRIEGVHLRFGRVARGGLRWSDRREDFRTEVLGLVKAQMVKNAVIVPTGSKGGFVAKQLPDPAQDRDAWQAEGVAAYTIFIKGLLDVTDNRVGDVVEPPPRVVRHDEDDPYLVVAADKGTATFSDLANAIAQEYGFWLDDAFASGGSAGYDHKGMGITARGAWESVKRHFRELGLDTQREDFTVVGIGDMSGDVFGNGMLLSEHIRLVAAFDHRHIFLDPDPDAATSFAERRRLFELRRSTWEDYDRSLISEGGGVYPRTAKSVPVSPQVRVALGLPDGVTQATPNELLRAILAAPADLMWNGGIGTYVKSRGETHSEVGDRANDAIRVDGADLRVRVVGEGGNLGLTQLGRIEAAHHGVHVNTDAIDNSAGVDTSDHEVNIKIALTPLVRDGRLSRSQRDELLASMTDEVAAKVLRHNYEQNVLIGNARGQRGVMVTVHARLMDELARTAGLDRELEFLPGVTELEHREERGEGLTSPEFSVLVAYAKLALKDTLLESEVPDDEHFEATLLGYFPEPLRERYAGQLREHPLRRQIIVNELANQMVNRGGVTFAFRAAEETGATTPQIARAFVACREIFGLADYVSQVEALDNQVPTQVQTALYLEFRRLLDRSVRWFLNNQSLSGRLDTQVERFAEPVRQVSRQIPQLLQGSERKRLHQQAGWAREQGVPEELALRYAALLDSYSLLDVVEVAESTGRPVSDVAVIYFSASERFRVDALLTQVSRLPRENPWDSLARGALRDDLYGVLRSLTATMVRGADGGEEPTRAVTAWSEANEESITRVNQVLANVDRLEHPGMAPVSVALRTLRGLVRQGSASG